MDQPVISIIVAAKNAERYLSQSLDSIAAQTYRAFEVVVVDGGSTDNSICIAEAYPNTTCIKQVGTGFTGAWNEGIDASRGSHIAFLDSDDIWVTHKLAIQMEYYAGHPETDCVIGHVKFFIEDGNPIPPGFKPSLLTGSHVAYIPGSAVIRRSVFDRIGKFQDRWKITSDLVWFGRLRESGMSIGVLDDVLLHKRIHTTNLTFTSPWPVYRGELTRLLKESLNRRRGAST